MADHSVSRGEVISLIAGIPLAVSAVAGTASAAGTASKASMKYVDKSTVAGKTCSNCSLFIPGKTKTGPGTCKLVAGAISPGGYCIAWAPKAK
jgi:hypothetical protein